jgi:hypothetical protein
MKTFRVIVTVLSIAGCGAFLVACGGSEAGSNKIDLKPGDPFDNYDAMNVHVIGADQGTSGSAGSSGGSAGSGSDSTDGEPVPETPVLVGSTDGGDVSMEQVCISDSLCEVPPVDQSNWCEREGGPVDLIYADGELVQTICYPPADDPDRPTELIDGTQQGDLEVAQTANRTTVLIDPSTNGMPITGDVSVDGNNVSIYGNGPDNTILDGDVTLDGNNVRLRGVTITGDLIISKNRVAVVLCRILGNVRLDTMSTNGSVFAENDIFGDFISTSNNNIIVGNDVLGQFETSGHNAVCDRNASFVDTDGDQLVDDDERGAELACQ